MTKLLLIDLAQITQGLLACNLIVILAPKFSSSHIPWLNVGEMTAPPDANGYLTLGGPTILILHDGVLRTLIDAEVVYAGEQ